MYALIADDLTGALDAGAGFAAAGLRAVLPLSGNPADAPGADVLLINTASREGTASAAREAVARAAERLKAAGITRVYKKMDSVLRGHPGAELAAVLDVFRGRALVAPAFPAQGRVTRGGVQYAHGTPVEPFGGFLRDALESAAARADVRDAESDDELARIAAEGARNPGYRVWCGTAGLARYAPAALGLTGGGPQPVVPRAARVLVLAGTPHPATNAQLDALAAEQADAVTILVEGRRHITPGRTTAEIGADIHRALEEAAQRIEVRADTALILTGGESAQIVCRALGARSIEVVGEALPGIAIGLLRGAGMTMPIATKSGGFGARRALVRVAERLLEGG